MDRVISTAWRAFWVGLGASVVLIGQAVLTPANAAAPAVESVPGLADPAQEGASGPTLSRDRFDFRAEEPRARLTPPRLRGQS
jgi:hypothetical protein